MNYYNEFDPKAAAWLRELIAQGHIPNGDVDERSIEDVRPSELHAYTQCHFFAGIGGWPYALRLSGWPDNRPVWTGSCPCQPFSVAGKRGGTSDKRHLFPAWRSLISECRPAVVFGEQVASKDGRSWLNTVRLEMEAMGYGVGAADLCAAGVGAPHIRQRLWFVGERVGDTIDPGLEGHAGYGDDSGEPGRISSQSGGSVATLGRDGRLADSSGLRREWGKGAKEGREYDRKDAGRVESDNGHISVNKACDGPQPPGPTNGYWRDADWLGCRDGKFRPVRPGTFPLGNGLPARVGRLRGYGNAIVPQVAAHFIQSYMEI